MESSKTSSEFSRPINVAMTTQLAALFMVSCIMDPNPMCLIALTAVGFWIGVAIIRTRRPLAPAKTDLAYITTGYIPLLVIGPLAASPIWNYRGVISEVPGWSLLLGLFQ